MAIVDQSEGGKLRGKTNKKSKEVHRIINGKEYVYSVENEYDGPPSQAQKEQRSNFGTVNAIVNRLMANPVQVEEWKARMLEYNKSHQFYLTASPRRFKTVRAYAYHVISEQLTQNQAAKRRKAKMPVKLPKNIKLQVKSFSELSAAELYEILKARFSVFVAEQHIHYVDEDNIDYLATHFSLRKNGLVIAYARLFPDAQKGVLRIGRMLTRDRGKGFAKYIMTEIISFAQRGNAHTLCLHAQTQVVPFYEKLGFHPVGDIFIEAEIPHIVMEMQL